jgi:hypothetical protein
MDMNFVAQLIVLIDDALIYSPVETKATIEAGTIANNEPKMLLIDKQLMFGMVRIIVRQDGISVNYYPPDSETYTKYFSATPAGDDLESLQNKLRPIIRLDIESKKQQASPILTPCCPEIPRL